MTTASKTYNIAGDIDIMQDKTKLVILKEFFDIIGVYNHFYLGNDKNVIFAAACGKATTQLF